MILAISCGGNDEANIKFIVRAANAYAALVEALETFLDDLPDMTIVDGAGKFGKWMIDRITKAQAALAAAKGEG